MIPKKLHFIWVGNGALEPRPCIQTWIDKHPGWEIKVWRNAEFKETNWVNREHMKAMWDHEICGVSDLMRWEILFEHGGIYIDADSVCLKPIPDWWLGYPAFCCWENELAQPGLLAAGYFGAEPRNLLVKLMIDTLHRKKTVTDGPAWKTVGPLHLTQTWRSTDYNSLAIFPSHFLLPKHHSGIEWEGPRTNVIAEQYWGSTKHSYEKLAKGELG